MLYQIISDFRQTAAAAKALNLLMLLTMLPPKFGGLHLIL